MDKNYAHIFIFWDRLFGTFKGEEEEPNYGITLVLLIQVLIMQPFHTGEI